MKLRNVLLAATILAVPVAVKAQPVSGLYVGAGAGYNYLQKDKVNNYSIGGKIAPPYSHKLKDDGGPVALASVGYGFGNGLRVEIEGNYRQEHFRLYGSTGRTGGGNLLSYAPMANVFYDINFGSPIVPYVGVGAGYGFSQFQNVSVAGAGVTTTTFNNKTSGSVAGQAIVGVAYNIPAVPGLALTGEYRFFAEPQNEKFKGSTVGVTPAAGVSAKLESQYNHSVLIGFRYAFNAAPPPPPPTPAVVAPPAAAAARTYLVFFDWDRADLTARARQIISEAAQNSTRVTYTRIDVSGHADLSGTPQYNQGLSLRRAESVAAELVKDGVPRTAIDIHAYGDTHPLVPTARGVREPQNRRVEIVLK
jgi:OOP family OmpA-OmpF porin